MAAADVAAAPASTSAAGAAAGASAAAPEPAPLAITTFTLYYDAPGGCFASDRMRDTWPGWEQRLKSAGISVRLERSYGRVPNLHVAAEGSSTRHVLWEVVTDTPNAPHVAWSYPWEGSVADKIIAWARSGSPPADARVVG
jgi:hypothetical protein